MKLLFRILFTISNLVFFLKCAEGKEVSAIFILNGTDISSAKFYILKDHKATALKYTNSKLTIPDSLNSGFKILMVYKNYHIILNAPKPDDLYYLKLYYDNRIFNNLANFVLREHKFTLRFLFSKRYVILFGDGFVTEIVQKRKNNTYYKDIVIPGVSSTL